MIKYTIGSNAGKIWQLLNKNKEMSLKKLQKQSNLNDRDFYLVLGWLSRENKIFFFEEKEELYLNLIE